MAKEKLFTPEDFDKPKDKSFWQKCKNWIIGCIVIAALAVAIVALVKSCDTQKEVKEPTEKETPGTEIPTNAEGSETVEQETAPETKEVEQGEEQTAMAPVVDIPEVEPKPEATTAKPTTQPANVSDNIEQEAMNVIRGDYGNVPERREKLGSKYQEIQNRVNQLKKEGVF